MAEQFKPMLASGDSVRPEDLHYPLWATPKLDGVRAVILDGQVKQRSLKPVRNKFIQDELAGLPDGLDGELTVGLDFNKSSGDIRREEGEPDFTYWVFDCFTEPKKTYLERLKALESLPKNNRIKILMPIKVDTSGQLQELTGLWVSEGFEGAIVRAAEGPYKYGRSTMQQGWMIKIKDFVDEEATIIGCYELMINNNVAEKNLLGRTERSSNKENLAASGLLGGFYLQSPNWKDFSCGSMLGVTWAEREELWNRRDELIGQLVKFKYQPHGSQDRPRIPIFLGFRDIEDI